MGEHTSKLIDVLIERKQHPQQAFRAAAGIIRLSKRYGNDRVEATSHNAYKINLSAVPCARKEKFNNAN